MMDRHLSLRMFEANRVVIDHRWNVADVCSAFWRCYVNDDDGPKLILGGARRENWPIPAQRVVLVPAWVEFSCRNSKPVTHRYIHFDVVGMPAPLTQSMFPRPMVLGGSDALHDVVCDAVDRANDVSRLIGMLRVQSAVLQTLVLALSDHPQSHRLSYWLAGESRIHSAVEYIENNLDSDLSTAVLAGRCGLSEGHFTRLFREQLGQTPARFVLDRRVAHAAQRLAFTDQTIDTIAHATGFADRFHFSRVFAKRIGLPPARYRKGGNPQVRTE